MKKKIVYDFFIDENLHVKERVERARAQGRILGLQDAAIHYVKLWFPVLAAHAQPLIKQLQNPDELKELIRQLAVATTEDEARKLLRI